MVMSQTLVKYRVFKLLAKQPSLTVTEMSKELGLKSNTIYVTLTREGFLVDKKTGNWRLNTIDAGDYQICNKCYGLGRLYKKEV